MLACTPQSAPSAGFKPASHAARAELRQTSFADCRIEQDTIALFGSGNSVLELAEEERAWLLKKCFVITVNYAPLLLASHLNIWSDNRVTEFLAAHYRDRPKDRLFLAQNTQRHPSIASQVDFWFNRATDGLKGNYTVVWALQLLQKFFPEKRVLLFGFDGYIEPAREAKWYDRYTDFDRTRRASHHPAQSKLDQCATQLAQYCRRDNVYNCNPRSRLDCFEKREWQELLPLRIVHLTHSPLAGAPTHLSKILNRYTRHHSTTVLQRGLTNPAHQNLRWDYDHVNPAADAKRALLADADLVHLHQRPDPAAGAMPALLQFHAEPAGYRPAFTHAAFNGRKLVIAQYHPRFYTDAQIVPNLIDIWDEAFRPAEKPAGRVRIFFSWATERKGGWGDKGSAETQRILAQIEARFGERVEIVVMNNRPHSECLAAKRPAHICIDECVTGSYHLQSLEGCSVGAVTFNALDEQTSGFLREVTGTNEHPFFKSGLDRLFDDLCHLIEHPAELARKGQAARIWMERHWNPRMLVRRFARAYYDVLLFGKIRPFVAPAETPPNPTAASSPAAPPPARTATPRVLARPPPPAPALRPAPVVSAPVRAIPVRPAMAPSSAPLIRKEPFRADPLVGRPIAELHRRHAGEEIVVFGTGPSLFCVNPEDYRGKTCIGVNFACEVVPHLRYHFMHNLEVYQALSQVLPAEQCVLPETLVRQPGSAGPAPSPVPTRVPNPAAAAWVYRLQDPCERDLARKDVSFAPDAALFTWSTTAHSAIHFAAFLGAARITLVGMDYALFPGGRVHFKSRHLATYGDQRWHALAKHRQGDEWLARKLAKEGVPVINASAELRSKGGAPLLQRAPG